LGGSYQGEEVISKEKRKITPKVGKERAFLSIERLSLKSNFPSLREMPSRSRPSLSKRRKMFEDPK